MNPPDSIGGFKMILIRNGFLVISAIGFFACLGWFMTFQFQRRRSVTLSNRSAKYQFYLLVPLLNEAESVLTTVAQQLRILDALAPQITPHLVLINDGSTDATAANVAALQQTQAQHRTRIELIRRRLPEAQQGKGAALNAAVAQIKRTLPAHATPATTIIGVVDADGLISSADLMKVFRAFTANPVAMVQTNIAMTNPRVNWLTRMQNFEFIAINAFMQEARNRIGAAIASGNGQFMTLAMVLDTGWGASLLEDFEFTVRGVFKGYHGLFLPNAVVYQEAVTRFKPLFRQRIRWCTGSMQCFVCYGQQIVQSPKLLSRIKCDLLLFLILPFCAMVLLIANLVALGTQLVNLVISNPHPVIFAFVIIILLTLLLWTVFALEYVQTTGVAFPTAVKLSWQAVGYNVCLSIVPFVALYKLLSGDHRWDKTIHAPTSSEPAPAWQLLSNK